MSKWVPGYNPVVVSTSTKGGTCCFPTFHNWLAGISLVLWTRYDWVCIWNRWVEAEVVLIEHFLLISVAIVKRNGFLAEFMGKTNVSTHPNTDCTWEVLLIQFEQKHQSGRSETNNRRSPLERSLRFSMSFKFLLPFFLSECFTWSLDTTLTSPM